MLDLDITPDLQPIARLLKRLCEAGEIQFYFTDKKYGNFLLLCIEAHKIMVSIVGDDIRTMNDSINLIKTKEHLEAGLQPIHELTPIQTLIWNAALAQQSNRVANSPEHANDS